MIVSNCSNVINLRMCRQTLDSSLRGCYVVSTVKYLPAFRRLVIPYSSGCVKQPHEEWKVLCSSETSVAIYQPPRHHISEDSNFQRHRCENLKSSVCISYICTPYMFLSVIGCVNNTWSCGK